MKILYLCDQQHEGRCKNAGCVVGMCQYTTHREWSKNYKDKGKEVVLANFENVYANGIDYYFERSNDETESSATR